MVDVSNKHKSITVGVSSNNGNTIVTAKSDTAQYWANQSKDSAQKAEDIKTEITGYIEGFDTRVQEANDSIDQNSANAINALDNAYTIVSEEIRTQAEEAIGDLTQTIDNSIAEYTEIANQIKQDNSESSQLAQDWAISEVIVDNLDYSAKYWAGKAKDNSGIFYDEISEEDIDVEIISGGYVTKADLELGLDTKQDKGNYALVEDIPDLTDYVKNTDYATADKGGVIKQSTNYGFSVNTSTGIPFASTKGLVGYQNSDGNMFIGKNTLENIKNDFVKRAVTENDIELTDDEKASARTWIGAIGTEDYASATTAGSAGIVKCSSTFACGCVNGYIQAMNIPTLERYNNLSQYAFIGKATLQTALTQYSKTVLTTEADYNALATKDANTLYLIEE